MYVFGAKKRVHIPMGSEDIYLTIREPTTEEMLTFMKERFEVVGKDVKENQMGASINFVNKILVDVEGMGFIDDKEENQILTNKTKDWKDKIPAYFKRMVAFMYEGASGATLEEAKPT